MDPDDPAYRGQADYTRWLLAIYDPFVLGFMAPSGMAVPHPARSRPISPQSGAQTP